MRKIIFIDWFETLCSHKLWGHLETENPVFFNQIQSLLFNQNQELCNEWMRGWTRFCNICHFFENHNIPRSVIQTEFIRDLPFQTVNAPTFLPLIQKLRAKGYKVYIATDHFDVFGCYIYVYHHFEEFFDGYLSSAEIGFLKNDRLPNGIYPFFDSFLKENNLTFADCFFIDNSKKTCDTYQTLGMKTIHISSVQDVENVLNNLLKLK